MALAASIAACSASGPLGDDAGLLSDAEALGDGATCPRVVGVDAGVSCTFENRYDIDPDFEAAAARLGCPNPNPVCHYSCDDQHAREAFACATSCPDLYWQDRQLCGP